MKAAIGQWAIGLVLALVAAACWRLHDFSAIQPVPVVDTVAAGGLVTAWLALVFIKGRGKRATAGVHDAGGILVVHASQTGSATELAARTEATLRAGGRAVDARAIDELTPGMLRGAACALFVVSTTGEGDAPDMAVGFQRTLMAATLALPGLSFGILALGDRDYDDFCAFGRDLDRWLRGTGATPAFDRVEVDNGDEGAVRHWQHHVGQIAGTPGIPDWTRPAYQRWHLAERRLLNPGSAGAPCFHVALVPETASALAWDAGDIVEIGPRRAGHDPSTLPHREYSIASVPADGALHLVVRQMRGPDGAMGLGSGWLTDGAMPGDTIDVRVRRNVGFHAPDDDRPVLLIGNGTGVAGLRALLKARIARGHRHNWLVYGERQAAVDRLHVDELEHWHHIGAIERLDLVWSRDGHAVRYVQDALRGQPEALRDFVARGASIYVCGSLAGMAPGVDDALRDVLGAAAVDGLMATGRYRRDVY